MEHEMHFSFKEFKPLTFCGKPIGFGGDVSVFQKPFEIKPTKGEHSLKSCKKCKANLTELTQRLTDLFNGKLDKAPFPHCCVPHGNLLKDERFDRNNFVKVPEQTAKKIMYAYHHIINHVNNADWKENITDYIDWAQSSFGQFPTGCGQPLFLNEFVDYLCGLVQNSTDIPEEKKTYILHYLKGDQQTSKASDTDLQALLTTYEKWITLFPFGVNEFFGDLKSSFQKHLPLVKSGSIRKNRYSGTITMRLCTEGELVERLMELSKDLLGKVNSKTLYEKGLITDKEKHRFDLISETHRVKQATLLNNYTIGEIKYAELLSKWLESEKDFFAEAEPYLNTKAIQPKNEKTEKRNYLALAFYYYYKQSVGEIEWFDKWQGGRERAYSRVVDEHYTNPAKTAWKQFQTEYSKIENEHSSNRWQHCTRDNYHAIMELLKDSPKGLAKAKAELSKAIE